MSYEEHRQLARDTPVRCAVITISDTRTAEDDRSGAYLLSVLARARHEVAAYRLVPDEPAQISDVLDEVVSECEVVLTSGGTGISLRDTTIEVVESKFEKRLPGFGELFRMLSHEEIGSGAMLSRATAGLVRGTLIFAMPGSTNAVRLAMEQLILPEMEHLVWEVVRQAS